jgi:hypothetical protein
MFYMRLLELSEVGSCINIANLAKRSAINIIIGVLYIAGYKHESIYEP